MSASTDSADSGESSASHREDVGGSFDDNDAGHSIDNEEGRHHKKLLFYFASSATQAHYIGSAGVLVSPKDDDNAIKQLGEWIRDQQTMEETITILQQQGWMV